MKRENAKKDFRVDGSKMKIAVVVSRFNGDITESLLAGALATLKENKIKKQNIDIAYVPGSFEVPLGCLKFAATEEYDGIVALGCIIRGETDHDFYLASAVSKGLMDVSLAYAIPISFGILTTSNLKQAQARIKGKGNKGREAAQAVLEMI